MCCFFAILVFLGPRAGILIWYLINPALWARAFPQSWIVPLAGSIVVPWTTMMYVLLFPGGITGWDYKQKNPNPAAHHTGAAPRAAAMAVPRGVVDS
jgi:hypothetical protein